MAVSRYSTLLRIAFTKPLEQYLAEVTPDRRNYNHAETSAQWARIFGEECCRFKVFDRAEFPHGDIRRDFLHALPSSPDFEQLSLAITSANESLPRYQARLYRAINSLVPHWKPGKTGVNRLNLRLKETIDSVINLGRSPMPQTAKQAVRERFVACNREFLAQWAPERTDLLEHGKSVMPAQSGQSSKTDTEELLADLLGALVSDHLKGDRFLEQEDARALMKIYRKFTAARPDDREDALVLLQLAARANPNGPQIQRALATLTAEQGSKTASEVENLEDSQPD
jgi:hypothetical protein